MQISDETLSCLSDLIEFGLLFDLPHSDGSHGCPQVMNSPILYKATVLKGKFTYDIVNHCLAVYLLKWGSMVGVRPVSIAPHMSPFIVTGKHISNNTQYFSIVCYVFSSKLAQQGQSIAQLASD